MVVIKCNVNAVILRREVAQCKVIIEYKFGCFHCAVVWLQNVFQRLPC